MTMTSTVVTSTLIQITQHGNGAGLAEPGIALSGGGESVSAGPLPPGSVAVP